MVDNIGATPLGLATKSGIQAEKNNSFQKHRKQNKFDKLLQNVLLLREQRLPCRIAASAEQPPIQRFPRQSQSLDRSSSRAKAARKKK